MLTCFFCSVEDVGVISALDDLVAGWGLQGNLVGHHLEAACTTDLHKEMGEDEGAIVQVSIGSIAH